MMYKLVRSQQLNCNIETAWHFFSSPHNLARITPGDMNFKVTSKDAHENIYPGMTIDYTVTPLLGIPVAWRTKILQVDEWKSFTDYQLKGPYKTWKHFHEFIPNDQGVLMKDTVDYTLPFGIVGDITHALLVKKKLDYIFNYRYRVLEKLFNAKKECVKDEV